MKRNRRRRHTKSWYFLETMKGVIWALMFSVAALASASVFAFIICNPDVQGMCMYY